MKDKLLNRFIGVLDNRDEYQKQEIYKEIAFSGMMLWNVTMIIMFIGLIVDTVHNRLSLVTISLLIINLAYAVYILTRLRRNRLDETDCATLEEYEQHKKRLKKSSAIAGTMWGFLMLVLMQYLIPYISTGEIDVSWLKVAIWGAGGICFGIMIYWFSKSKLKKQF